MLCKIYIIVVFCFILVLGFRGLQSNRLFTQGPTFENLPAHSDLIEYFGALNRLIYFSGKHELDINSFFGLFLVNVNLNRALQTKQQVLPMKLQTYVKGILQKTENLLDIFKQKIKKNYDKKYKTIFSLFMNETTWINRLPKFIYIRLYEIVTYPREFDRTWIVYKKKVDDRNAGMPNPYLSDFCLASLALAQEMEIGTSLKCNVPKSCYEMIRNGTDFGYALAHRLLFLQQARFGRGCIVFSKREDEQMRRKFCSAAYQEVEYIAQHKFQIVDLLLEHVCLCALEGYVQFLKRSWLRKMLSFQTVSGCFSPSFKSTACQFPVLGDRGMDGYCNRHTTAVAAGTLAIASRFILEFYY